jgi:hypothetical protein
MKPLRRPANGSRCDLLPAEHNRTFSVVNTNVIDKVNRIIYKEVKMGAFQGLDLDGSPIA